MTAPPRAADPVAERSPRLNWAFGWYLRWYFYRRFNAVRVAHTGLPRTWAGRPVIVFGNHPSWWDPAFYILLCIRLFPDRAGYGPMDAAALQQYGVLRKMGVFGVDQSSLRGAARFMATSLHILSRPNTSMWITGEGHFTDLRQRPIRLRPGLAHLARRVPDAVLLPLAVEYAFWNESKPEALAKFGPPVPTPADTSVAGWTAQLEQALTETMDDLAQLSKTREPAPFVSLVHGGAGVGGIYDVYRRGRAWATGRRFNPAHEPHKAGE